MNDIANLPEIGEAQVLLLERLCNAIAISGAENEVRTLIKDEVRDQVLQSGGSVKTDALGNILITQPGTNEKRLRVMVAAHMDEVGLMITNEAGDGLFHFEVVGSVDVRQLIGKTVLVGKEHIFGVIGSIPIHLTTSDERKKPGPLDALCIDVGPNQGGKVKLGDRAAFATQFQQIGPSFLAKALDNRFGVASLIELIKNSPANIDLLAAFTVQEEIGTRGAQVAAYAFDPDIAIVLDCTPAYDLPVWDGTENIRYNTRLGAGPAIYITDRATISDPRLVSHFCQTADELAIPYQFRQPGGGGTDAGAIHKQRKGIPSISISVPGRYLHTAVSIARRSDWENTLKLVFAALRSLEPELLSVER